MNPFRSYALLETVHIKSQATQFPENSNHKKKEMEQPGGNTGMALQKNCDQPNVLLIDERSMIGCTTLGWMNSCADMGLKMA